MMKVGFKTAHWSWSYHDHLEPLANGRSSGCGRHLDILDRWNLDLEVGS